MQAYNTLNNEQALALDTQLIAIHLTEFEDSTIHIGFSYTDSKCNYVILKTDQT